MSSFRQSSLNKSLRMADSNIFLISDSDFSKTTEETSESQKQAGWKLSFSENSSNQMQQSGQRWQQVDPALADVKAMHNYDAITFGKPQSSSKGSERGSDEHDNEQLPLCRSRKSKFNKESGSLLKRQGSEEVFVENEFELEDQIRVNSSMLPQEFLKEFRSSEFLLTHATEETLKNISMNSSQGLLSPTAYINYMAISNTSQQSPNSNERQTPAFAQRKNILLKPVLLNEASHRSPQSDYSEGPFLRQQFSGSGDQNQSDENYLPSPQFVHCGGSLLQFSRFASDSWVDHSRLLEGSSPVKLGSPQTPLSKRFRQVVAVKFSRSARVEISADIQEQPDKPAVRLQRQNSVATNHSCSSKRRQTRKSKLLIEIPEVKECADNSCMSREKIVQTICDLARSGDAAVLNPLAKRNILLKLKDRVSKTPLLHRGTISSAEINQALKEKALQLQYQNNGQSGQGEDTVSESKSYFSEISEMRMKSWLDADNSGQHTYNRSQSGIVRISKSRGSSSRKLSSRSKEQPEQIQEDPAQECSPPPPRQSHISNRNRKLWVLTLTALALFLFELLPVQ